MSDAIRETLCTRCVHRTVCKYKDDFLKLVQDVNEAAIREYGDNNKQVKIIKAIDYECVSDISVSCRYCQSEAAEPINSIFN